MTEGDYQAGVDFVQQFPAIYVGIPPHIRRVSLADIAVPRKEGCIEVDPTR